MTTSFAQPHRSAIAGASGRMGQMLAQAVTDAVDCEMAGALDVADSVFIGNDATGFLGQASGVVIQSDWHHGFQRRTKGRHKRCQPRYRHRHGAQYERGRERHFEVAGDGRCGFGHRLRH